MSLSEEEQQRRLQKIINQKKKTDLSGLLRAQRDGTLDEFLAADMEKAGLTGEGEATAQSDSSNTTTAAAAPQGTAGPRNAAAQADVAEAEVAPAWGRAVEQLSYSNPSTAQSSSAQPSSYYAEDAYDEEYEGYAYSDDDYVDVQPDNRPTDSGVPEWLSGKAARAEEPNAPTKARPYSTNLTGSAQLQAQYHKQGYNAGYQDQYYEDQNPYADEHNGAYVTYESNMPQAVHSQEDESYQQEGSYEYEDIDPTQENAPQTARVGNATQVPPAVPAFSPTEGVDAANEAPQEKAPAAPKQRVVDETTLQYSKYLSRITVMCAMIVFVMVIVDMAIGFKDKSKYFVGIFVMALSLGLLGFETKTESFTRIVAEKFGFMFFPLGRFCFAFLIATLCFGLSIAGIIAGSITAVYAFGTLWIMILYPALPQHIRDRHGVDMFSSEGPVVSKEQAQQQPQPAPTDKV